jgi:S-adenosylmethionine:tRNA ribosyltransferase-isomerase
MLAINDFMYDLPDERIAKYPLPERDAAKLLVWCNGHIDHRIFSQLPDLLTGHETLFFNNTKVIPARLYFRKPSGGLIEVFLLEPSEPHLVELAMRATQSVVYQCTIGNLKRWAEGTTLSRNLDLGHGQQCCLRVTLLDKTAMTVRFEWDMPQLPFARIVEMAGVVPIPPYLNRDSEALDQQRYQTVYSKKEGAVAAPTAGLHFTPAVLEALQQKGIQLEELTLHVSAGTFRPVKLANALEHDMHSEQVIVRRSTIEALLQLDRLVVAVGTTSMRTLESLYWFGVALLRNPDAAFVIEQSTAFEAPTQLPSKQEALQAVMDCLERRQWTELFGSTQIYITPGYTFRICEGLITNFHQPGSTLMLLVAAFTGGQAWRDIYSTAMAEGYRFLSYGDSSLLWRGGNKL